MNDFVEYTARFRKDQQMRGIDWHDMIDQEEKINESEMELFKYPSDEQINEVGLRGLFIGNFVPWDGNEHAKIIKEKYGWEEAITPFERTYRKFSNLDDRYENGVHDYLKFVKFGYGRGTDHACKDIRSGKMTRETGIEMVKTYDHVKSSDLYHWLNYVDRDEQWFTEVADSFRSPLVWKQDSKNEWRKRNIWD